MVVHKQHHHVSEGAADLEANAPASDSHKHRSTPAIASAAGRQPPAVVAAKYEGKLLLSRNDGNALRLFQQVTGNALVGRCHDLVEDAGRLFHTDRSEEHTSELQSLRHLVCRLLLE